MVVPSPALVAKGYESQVALGGCNSLYIFYDRYRPEQFNRVKNHARLVVSAVVPLDTTVARAGKAAQPAQNLDIPLYVIATYIER